MRDFSRSSAFSFLWSSMYLALNAFHLLLLWNDKKSVMSTQTHCAGYEKAQIHELQAE
ncbi:unnamed protein product [Sphenostylis stenocarpa]|uniref:Uncharacterized protein n=1 Tax=Sphenostylis stenocarpa TaxID=92480 RepID=A0AA86SCZ8_9FABA|nr:unnamed protein product [Sphenostylis stenocarpa]